MLLMDYPTNPYKWSGVKSKVSLLTANLTNGEQYQWQVPAEIYKKNIDLASQRLGKTFYFFNL